MVSRGARVLLAAAGLPQAFWPQAAATFCHMKNTQENKLRRSAWSERKGSPFAGLKIPFGALIDYMPPNTTREYREKQKFDLKTSPGVFLGYELQPTSVWKRHYRVMPLSCVRDVPLLHGARGLGAALKSFITYTENLVKPDVKNLVFPLKEESDRANRTLAGRRDHLDKQMHMDRTTILMDDEDDPDVLEERETEVDLDRRAQGSDCAADSVLGGSSTGRPSRCQGGRIA